MTQPTSISQLGGKTIERVAEYGEVYDQILALFFTDGTWLRISSCSNGYEGERGLDVGGNPSDYERVALGFMTEDEYFAKVAAEKESRAKRQSEQAEARDRAEWERLRAKYEGATK